MNHFDAFGFDAERAHEPITAPAGDRAYLSCVARGAPDRRLLAPACNRIAMRFVECERVVDRDQGRSGTPEAHSVPGIPDHIEGVAPRGSLRTVHGNVAELGSERCVVAATQRDELEGDVTARARSREHRSRDAPHAATVASEVGGVDGEAQHHWDALLGRDVKDEVQGQRNRVEDRMRYHARPIIAGPRVNDREHDPADGQWNGDRHQLPE